MSYIGDTPWKKLKKLFMISTDLIKHYGIRYFIYVMRAEYEKKGFSMFRPDEKPLDATSNPLYQEQYTKLLGYFKEKFTTERGRINCSLNDNEGWRWLGIQYVIAEY